MEAKTNRKYPELNLKPGQYWLYCHTVTIEDGGKMYYIGYSNQSKCCDRWKPSQYKRTALCPYIERYGWDNIQHSVIAIVDDKHSAEVLEDQMIVALGMNGMVINKQRSGGRYRDNKTAYYKEHNAAYYASHKEELAVYNASWRAANPDYAKEHSAAWRAEHKEEILVKQKAYNKKRRATPEYRIYTRVHSFNRNHPDKIIETPMEARQKYIDYGYIPSYIKNDDLI